MGEEANESLREFDFTLMINSRNKGCSGDALRQLNGKVRRNSMPLAIAVRACVAAFISRSARKSNRRCRSFAAAGVNRAV